MITIPEHTLSWIMLKAREQEAKDADTSDGLEDEGDNEYDILEDRPITDDDSVDELRVWISELPEDQQAELVALYWLARDNEPADAFPDLLERAMQSEGIPTADYLMGEPLLAAMLADGLDTLGIDVPDALAYES